MNPTKKQLEAEIKEAEESLDALKKAIQPYKDKLEKAKELYDKLYVPKYKFEADIMQYDGDTMGKVQGYRRNVEEFIQWHTWSFDCFKDEPYYAFVTKEGRFAGIWKVSPEEDGRNIIEKITKAEYKEEIERC